MFRYVYGWFIFWRAFRMQRRKKHGAGKQNVRSAVYIAMCARWIVDGQHRGGRDPRMPCGIRFSEYLRKNA